MKIFFDSDTVTNEPGDFVIPKQVTRSEYRVHCFLVRFCLWGESIKVSTRRDCIYIVSYRCTQQLKFFACTVKTQDKHQKCSVWIVEISLIKYTFVSIYEYIEWNKRVLCLEQNVRMFFRLCRIQGERTVTHRPSARYEMPCFSGICSLTITHKRQDEKGSVASEQYSKGASAGWKIPYCKEDTLGIEPSWFKTNHLCLLFLSVCSLWFWCDVM